MATNRVIVDPNGRHFSANSFHRFGDDLSELILSYLSFEDKYRLQCVAKQWQRLILNKQTVLLLGRYFNGNYMRKLLDKRRSSVVAPRLKSLLKKCPELKTIEYRHEVLADDEDVAVITDCCQQLESIRIGLSDLSESVITRFGLQFGRTLKSVEFTEALVPEYNRLLLSYCPNIETIKCTDQQKDITHGIRRAEKLTKLQYKCYAMGEDFFAKLNLFAPNLQCLDLHVMLQKSVVVDTMTTCPLPKLKVLDMYLSYAYEEFVASIPQLVPNLEVLNISGDKYCIPSDNSFERISQLQSLKSLTIDCLNNVDIENDIIITTITDSGVNHLLDNCEQLKTIRLRYPANRLTTKTIDKLIVKANDRPNDKFVFEWLKTFDLRSFKIPKNLRIIIPNIPSYY